MHSGLADEMILMAVEQFLPSAAAGALVTFVLARFVPVGSGCFPASGRLSFSLGVFASCRFLPRPMALAGAWYLLAGLCLHLPRRWPRTSPWAMGVPYGVGQLLVAGILLFSTREGPDEH